MPWLCAWEALLEFVCELAIFLHRVEANEGSPRLMDGRLAGMTYLG
jgi:hypothetical protein